MAGKVVVNQVQLGDSVTASQNFTIQSNLDGSGKLARGNAGATTQDIITWDSAGRVYTPQKPVYRGSLDTAAGSNFYKVIADEIIQGFTRSGNFIVVPAAGFYYVHAQQLVSTGAGSAAYFCITQNGTQIRYAYAPANSTTYDVVVGALLQCVAGDQIGVYINQTITAAWASPHSGIHIHQVA